jgi:O-antigen/teichoic acid export membrane protein
MSRKANVVWNSVLLTASEAMGRLMRMFLVIAAARILGADEYGKFAFALVFPLLFQILADLGIHQLLIREIARDTNKARVYLANALFLKLFLSLFTLITIVVAANITGKPHRELVVVYIMAGTTILNSFSELFKSVFQAFQRMAYDAVSTVFTGLATTLLGIGILAAGGGIAELAWIYLLVSLLNLIYCVVAVAVKFSPITVRADIPQIKFLIREGYPFGVSFFFSTMYAYVDTVMLSLMTRDAVVGWYNTAYRLIFAMGFIPATVMKAVFPALSHAFKHNLDLFRSLFRRSFKTLFLMGFSIATLLCCLSDKIILLLYGEEFRPAAGVLRILVWSTAFIFITNCMTRTTRAANRQHFTARVVASSAFLNVVLNFILIPRLQQQGAALATLLTEANTLLFHIVFLSRHLVKPPLLKLVPKLIGINGVMAGVIWLTTPLSLVTQALLGMGAGLVMIVVTRYFSKEEAAFLRTLIRLKPAGARRN